MFIQVCGAAREVTGSCYVVEVGETRFLVDCGMHQGGDKEFAQNFEPFPFDPLALDFVVVTHAHIDHSGRLPRLVKQGFKKPIYSTPATCDLVEIMLSVVEGKLDQEKIAWSGDACAGVVMSSGGYPGEFRTGFPITISDRLETDVNVFFAGAAKRGDGSIVTSGGRVLTVTAMGRSMKEASEKVYRNMPYINFEGCHFRKDIAAREVN